jgi:hypothetical protein
MTLKWALLISTFFFGHSQSPAPADSDFLVGCWGAVAKGGGEYELSFEAISFYGLTEGGVSVPSASCPDARIRFSFMPPEIDERFRQEEERGGALYGTAGLRGRARVVPVERGSEFLLRVRVTRLLSLERMSDEDTEALRKQLEIG